MAHSARHSRNIVLPKPPIFHNIKARTFIQAHSNYLELVRNNITSTCTTLTSLFPVTEQPKPTMLRKHSTLSSLFGTQQEPTQHDPLSSNSANTKLWGRSRRESAGAGKAGVISRWKETSSVGGQTRAPAAAAGGGGYHSSVATSARSVIHGRTDWSAK